MMTGMVRRALEAGLPDIVSHEGEWEGGGEGEREGERRVQLVQSSLHTHVAQELLNMHCNKNVSVWRV